MAKSKPVAKRRSKKRVPAWAVDPFHSFLHEAERLEHVVRLSARGIGVLQAMPKVVEVLMEVDKDASGEASQRLENARTEAKLAKREVESGFPVLHSWAVVGLWALLEALIRTFVAEWLKHKRSVWHSEHIQRLKVRLGEYEAIPPSQRHHFVAQLLERDLGAGLKYGVARFETILEPFGLSGDIPEIVRRTIYELAQVRNLAVHRASKVDRRFLQACPWLDVRVGDQLHVSVGSFNKYTCAAMAYVTLLICRVKEHFGINMAKHRASTEEFIDRQLADKTLRRPSTRRR